MNTLKIGYLTAREDGGGVVIGTEFPEEPLSHDQTRHLYEFLGDILTKTDQPESADPSCLQSSKV